MKIRLNRIAQSEHGTFGVISHNELPLCVTIEDPWNNNQKNISCIPEGIYQCVPHSSMKYPEVWRLENVPNRDAILIHAGNTINDTQGCILVGQHYYGRAILKSQLALEMLRIKLPDNFELQIKNSF